MFDMDIATWVWVVGWLLFGSPPVYYMAYRRFARNDWEQGSDVPASVMAWAALCTLPCVAIGIVGAAIVLGIASYVIIPLIVGISALLPSLSKDDLTVLANFILFGLPVAAAYVAAGVEWGEDQKMGYPQSPRQERRAYERWKKNQKDY